MKTNIKTTLALIPVMLLMAVSFTSCDDDDYYDGPYAGPLTSYDWELYSVNGFTVAEADVVEFQFFRNGTGTYGRYDTYMQWYTVPITWNAYGQGPYTYLQVWVNSSGQNWEYQLSIGGGYNPVMQLYDLDTGNTLVFTPY